MKKMTRWSHDEVEVVKAFYGKVPASIIAKELGRSETSVIMKAYNLGLIKGKKIDL